MLDAATALPDDPATLKAMLAAARAENADLTHRTQSLAREAEALKAAKAEADARTERLEALLKALERARYGRRAETLDPDQRAFVFEEIETGLAAVAGSLEATAPVRPERAPRPRKPLPPHLERIEVVIEPALVPCACGCSERVSIGEDVSERLDACRRRSG